MKLNLLLVLFLLAPAVSNAQYWAELVKCCTDTVHVEQRVRRHIKATAADTLPPHKSVCCQTRSPFGLRLDVGFSQYYYGPKTSDWLGQHGGPNFNVSFVADKVTLGLKYRPWTINPAKEVEVGGAILLTYASLNPIKLDYYIGYSFDHKSGFSLEPYTGYTRSSFHVINGDELKQKYAIPKTGGVLAGLTLNKYFYVKEYVYIAVYGSFGYSFVDYTKVHPAFDKGYFDLTAGVSFKGFFQKTFQKIVN